MDDPQPPLGWLLAAGFAAACAAALPVAIFFAIDGPDPPSLVGAIFLFAMAIALLHAFLVGLPAYVVLREKWALTWPRALLGGFLVGALPTFVVALVVAGLNPDLPWIAGAPAMLGAIGGAAFRAVLGLRPARR